MSSPPDHAPGASDDASPIAAAHAGGKFNEEFDASRRGSSLVDGGASGLQRSNSAVSQSQTMTPSRGGTLKKRNSLKKSATLRRSSSRRSVGAGSVKSLALGDREKYEGADFLSAFNTPVPTKGSPTEILAARFQDWRRVLKDLISYFREVQKTHEARSKSLLSLSNLASNISGPVAFRKEGGIAEATTILKQYHKQALIESNKAKSIEDDIMQQLTGLRSDLGQKIKEIKNLSGDFKNSCEKETDTTRKAVRGLQESLGLVDSDPSATSGRGDPFIVRLAVERQVERQIDEENYLHKAFLNLEHSGRELESIVVGEIQKAYNAYAGILKREADEAYETVENLRTGPVMMPKDAEWDTFVSNNESFVDPRMPLRKPHQITYPGRDAPAAAEVRSGLLERKSKYLKSYTPGWYVLSPTHLHEFKSPDRISSQTPIMSLYLQEQKLGSHSGADSSSHKFMLKGRQTGGMHRGHGWVFRAESRDTMLAWYEDIKNLTEKTGVERDAFVRRHARSISANSMGAGSVSSDGGLDEDDADRVPYSATNSTLEPDASDSPAAPDDVVAKRPQPGGRFPSEINVHRDLPVPLSTSSGASSDEHMMQEQQQKQQRGVSGVTRAIPARNPTEKYREESYQAHHDELYHTTEDTVASPESMGYDFSEPSELLASPPPIVDTSQTPIVAAYAGSTGVTRHDPPLDSTRPLLAKDPIPTADINPAAASHMGPPTPVSPVTTFSDPDVGSTEHLTFGAAAAAAAAREQAFSEAPEGREQLLPQRSEPSISNMHVPGEFLRER